MSGNEQKPTDVVLMVVVRTVGSIRQVLLGRKLTGFGAGRVVAPGGKIEPGESALQAAVRELREETGVQVEPGHVQRRAAVFFRFPANPKSDMDCQVFLTEQFRGDPAVSSELDPGWYNVDDLPTGDMWQDAHRWLPRILAGELLSAAVYMADDNLNVDRVEFGPLS